MPNKICGIYCIENIINNKKYIGQSINIYSRWNAHKRKLNKNKEHNDYFQNSWKKYGKDNFIFYIIEECSKEELNNRETFWINEFKTIISNGYNADGGGNAHTIISKETRNKISIKSLGHILSENSKNKIRIFNIGKKKSKETKEKISKNHADLSGNKNPNFEKKLKNSSSIYHGVFWIKRDKKWYVYCNKKYCGSFLDEINAAKTYDKFVIENNLDKPLNFSEDYK